MFFELAKWKGMTVTIAIEIAYFYATQCTSPPLFVEAFHNLFINEDILDRIYDPEDNLTMYAALVEQCCAIKKNTSGMMVGVDAYPRFSPGNRMVLDRNELEQVIANLRRAVSVLRTDLDGSVNYSLRSKEGKMQQLRCTQGFLTQLTQPEFKGLGTVTGRVFNSIIGCMGVIPLVCVISTPLHNAGGTGNFIANHMKGWGGNTCTGDTLLERNAELWHELSSHINFEVTPEVIKQTFCLLDRIDRGPKFVRKDLHMTFFRYNGGEPAEDHTRLVNGVLSDRFQMQSFYRIKGDNSMKWYLECYDGNKRSVVFSDNSKREQMYQWDWESNRLLLFKVED